MANDGRITALLSRWEEQSERGEDVSAEELCRDCPDLAPELRRRIHERRKELPPRAPTDDVPTCPQLSPPQVAQSSTQSETATLLGYELLEEVGRGSMGIVYRAYDQKRGRVVALKMLQGVSPAVLSRFKHEFRALADVTHPNLVTLYELVSEGPRWFISMEFVEGVNFRAYVRSGAPSPDPTTLPEFTPALPTGGPAPSPSIAGVDLGRLRDALRQLAEGVVALHEKGKLHRDIKPGNIRVTPHGRVVLLDFGLSVDLDGAGLYQSTQEHLLGTVGYMAPEQAASRPVSPASDWYSVGVVLYEALTGRLPFTGTLFQVLNDKQALDPAPPHTLAPDVPDDLEALCLELLRHDPAARPSGREVLSRLGIDLVPAPLPAPGQRPLLVGRELPLKALADAFRAVQTGRTVALFVHGPPGVGKSALLQCFLQDAAAGGKAVVLAGRCYEQESVPYKALDSLIDALGRYLRRLPDAAVPALLPRDVLPLARVFPVLEEIPAVASTPRRSPISNPQELRRRAFAGLRELLARLGDRMALILAIDDLHWGDIDSAAMLNDLLQPPDPPVMLLLGSYRRDDADTSPFLRALHHAPGPVEYRELSLEPLPVEEAARLTLALLGHADVATQDHAEAIARESRGNPLFVHELVQHLRSGTKLGGDAVTLDGALGARVERLPGPARRLLEVLAVAGRPIRRTCAGAAAALGADEAVALAVLRSGLLIRHRSSAAGEELETSHDRIREIVLRRCPVDVLREHHLSLARTLLAAGGAEPEALADHFHSAGQTDTASHYYAAAAAQAATALAFNRAAELYRLALELRGGAGAEDHRLRADLGHALAGAGRGAEAAAEYLRAAGGAPPAEALDLQRRAAEHYLTSGHAEKGLDTLRTVLAAWGEKLAPTSRGTLLAFLARRLQLWLRGLQFRERGAAEVPAEDLARIDIFWSAACGVTTIDPIRGAYFQARHLLLALRAGEPYRVARALALEAIHSGYSGGPAAPRVAGLLDSAERIAQRLDVPQAWGTVVMARGMVAYMQGRWQQACQHSEQAAQLLRDHCTGVAWELDNVQAHWHFALLSLGEFAELRRRLPGALQQAEERGDLHGVTHLGLVHLPVLRLADDDWEGARRELEHLLARCSQRGYEIQRADGLFAAIQIDLYRGHATEAWEQLRRLQSILTGSLLLRMQVFRCWFYEIRARTTLAVARQTPAPAALLRAAESDARRLERERMPWADALARLTRAGVAAVRGDPAASVRLFTEAAALLDSADMRFHAAVARRCLGLLRGDAEGLALIAHADGWMAAQQIRNPARMAAAYSLDVPDRRPAEKEPA